VTGASLASTKVSLIVMIITESTKEQHLLDLEAEARNELDTFRWG